MPTPFSDETILKAIANAPPKGASIQDLQVALGPKAPRRTLQYRLQRLVETGRLIKIGVGRGTRYSLAADGEATPPPAAGPLLSPAGRDIQAHVAQPRDRRQPAGYDRAFLDSYRPNETYYLSSAERAHLTAVGQPHIAPQPAGTYAKQILHRLLIDLAWNSSRLEGNTYSLLDTKRLIELGQEAEGRAHLEAQMILNHKDAIEFLVNAADDIGFNRYTILNLHALLANNLLANAEAAGRLRYIAVGIEGSTFVPLAVPQPIEECFDEILAKASAIADPFEQSLFVMVHLPYLQPFDDVNKRVSRLAANIPLIKRNLSPLSFDDVPRPIYTEAILGLYELTRTELLRDLFIWAYERSAQRHAAVRQSLGEPDPFRLKHREPLRELVATLVREAVPLQQAHARITAWATEAIPPEDQVQFIEIAEAELTSLHEGNFARYRIRPSEFTTWRRLWRPS